MKTFDERRKSVNEYVVQIRARRRKRAILAVAACLLAAVLSAVLFIPYDTTPPDVSMYSGSEYYAVIQQLNLATYQKPKYKNNFHALAGAFSSSLKAVENMAPQAPGNIGGMLDDLLDSSPDGFIYFSFDEDGSTSNGKYEEVTDNQVEGVIESDLMKRSDKYIFYLRKLELSVYSIAGEASQLVGTYRLRDQSDHSYNYEFYTATSMFLSMDCKTVTVILQGTSNTHGKCVTLVNLDVTDPAKIRIKNEVYFTGSYESARMVDGDILMIYQYTPFWRGYPVDFSQPATYVPKAGNLYSMVPIPAENIVCPEDANSTRYTVVCRVDGASLEIEGSTALLGYSSNVYVSRDTVYAIRSYVHQSEPTLGGKYTLTDMTQITGISYTVEGLETLGTVTLEGWVNNQYSMDAYEGILRVVTSTDVRTQREQIFDDFVSLSSGRAQQNVNLYCVDLSDWLIKASVIGFAPEGEEATSVRFDGTNAYVCTAEVITLTDPVYFFDLSDLENITYTDTGVIDGFSTSLIQLGDGYLLGIGYGENRFTLKIEVYEETTEGVVSVCSYEKYAYFSEVYKAYFIDRERKLVGLAIKDREQKESVYILLHFDGYEMNVVKTLPCDDKRDSVRAALIDGYFYLLSRDSFFVEPME